MMRISVIIPAYNAAGSIRRAIDSVLAQTYPAQEIVVVNDGSTDNTAEVLKQYQNQIRVIEQSNAGVSAARNTGIQAASGDWIAFLDADDQWLPDKLHLQSALVMRNPELSWVSGDFNYCDCSDGHHRRNSIPNSNQPAVDQALGDRECFEDFFTAFLLRAYGHTDTMLIRKESLIKAGLFIPGQQMIEDEDLWFRLAYLGLKVGFVRQPLAVYHLGAAGSLTKITYSPDIIDEFLERHLSLSRQAGLSGRFIPCARIELGFWIHRLLLIGQGGSVRRLLKKHGRLLTGYCRCTSYIGSYCPAVWAWNEKRNPKAEG